MRIVTKHNMDTGVTSAHTAAEFAADANLLDDADDWVWQDQPSKEAAIARHEEAVAAWQLDQRLGRKEKDTY